MEMKKNRKWIHYGLPCAVAIMIALGTNELACFAKEGITYGSTAVTYIKEKSDQYLLHVSVQGNGSVFDGDGEIRNQINQYDLPVDEEKTFQIRPDSDSKFIKVTLNGVDISDQVDHGQIRIHGKEEEQEVVFYFEKKNVIADTGTDQSTTYWLIAVLLGAGGIALGKKQFQDDEE